MVALSCDSDPPRAATSFTPDDSTASATEGVATAGDGATSGEGPGSTSGDGTGISAGDPTTTSTTGNDDDDDDQGGCQSNADCTDDLSATVCDVDSGTCVGCTATDDPCALGTHCDDGLRTCVEGCVEDEDCGQDLFCNTVTQECTGCLVDDDCPLGTLCDGGTCESGCSPTHGCQPGLACCGTACVDILTDLDHCGGCDAPCTPANADGECVEGECGIASCDDNFNDCNHGANDGCEEQGTCACAPGTEQDCYTGPNGTANVGACASGTQTCNEEGTGWSLCSNQTTPILEICGNGEDDDCDGAMDEDPDLDADGWTVCGGDCCDSVGPNCLTPLLVNPGAFEFAGNTVDDDCDGFVDNALTTCDAGIASNTNDTDDYARAIDLCQFTTLNPVDPADRRWGVISTAMLLADGTPGAAVESRAVRNGFGQNIGPREGSRIAMLSTGHAADVYDLNPGFSAFQPGTAMGTATFAPNAWLTANGGAVPNAPGCPSAPDASAFNPVMFETQIRVPTNARSFSVQIYFFSAEYPEFVCTPFNDFFITLIDSQASNTTDGNIAIYDDGNDVWPVGVNILDAAPGLFTQCENGPTTQCTDPQVLGSYAGCTGTNELTGTGFDLTGPTTYTCEPDGRHGGGTGWLTLSGNVEPGEVMTLQFVIWDTGDQYWDSLVLLDDFVWSVQASEPGVTPN